MGKFIDLTGQKFGRLTVIERDFEKETQYKKNIVHWKCLCECGNYTSVAANNIKSGTTKSCGCLNKETRGNSGKKNKKFNKYDLETHEYGVGTMNDGNEFFFDKEDFHKIKDICWHLQKGYIVGLQDGARVRMHRLLMNASANSVVDHVNHDKRDNRKFNLRVCEQNQNAKNRRINKNNVSGCTGVYYCNRDKKWCASIKVNYKKLSLGRFNKKEDAIDARKKAEPIYFGEYRRVEEEC